MMILYPSERGEDSVNDLPKHWFRLTYDEVERRNPPPLGIVEDEDTGQIYIEYFVDERWHYVGHVPTPQTHLGWFVHHIIHGLAMRYPWHKVIGWAFWYSFIQPIQEREE